MNAIRTPSLLFVALVASCLAASGAIPIETEREFQAKAPEKLEIEVTKVRRLPLVGGVATIRITAEARVTAVTESATGLEVDDVIEIRYEVPAVPIPGAPPSVVRRDRSYAAYLRVADAEVDEGGRRYQPAAHSGTFEPIGERE